VSLCFSGKKEFQSMLLDDFIINLSMIVKPYLIIILSVISLNGFSMRDSGDTLNHLGNPEPYHRNVIKFNPTPMLLFNEIRNITFSYERLITDNQSIVVQAGYLTFGDIFNDTIAHLINFKGNSKQKGLNLGFDYRYYPVLRNRRPAPDGLFIGGYVVYYGFQYNNAFDILGTEIDQNGKIEGKINIVNAGFNLGYQFVFWKRLTIDLLMFGPSLNYTQSKGEITGNLDQEQIEAISDEIIDKLINHFPALTQVFSEESLNFSGSHASFGTGFRYAIQVGFHF
jgi:hypothetical protein